MQLQTVRSQPNKLDGRFATWPIVSPFTLTTHRQQGETGELIDDDVHTAFHQGLELQVFHRR